MSNSKRLDQLLDMLSKSYEPFLLFAVAKEYEKMQQLPDAEENYKKLLTDFPDYVGSYYHYGKLMEKQADFERATEIYSLGIAVAQKAGDRHALSELAEAKMNLED
jgi:tetratricopeptide (TPR) repeat protein